MPTSILHVSDLHFGADRTVNPNAPDPVHLADDIADMAAKRQFHPSCVVLSGDFTMRATAEEFVLANNFILRLSNRLKIDTAAIVIVPGNHDVHWDERAKSRSAGFRNYQQFFNWIRPTREPDEKCWFTCKWSNGQLFVLGLNSCFVESKEYAGQGYVEPEQLTDAEQRFAADWRSAMTRVAVIHHHLVPVSFNAYDPVKPHPPSVTINTQQVIEWLLEHDFQLVLHGHQHQPFYAAEKRFFREHDTPAGVGSVDELLLIGAGSAGGNLADMGTIRKRSLHLLNVSESEVQVHTLQFETRQTPVNTYVRGTLPLRHRSRSDSLNALIELLDRQRLQVLQDARPLPAQGKATFLRVERRDLVTLAPVIYQLAGHDVLATSFVPLDFWNGTLGQLVLESTTRVDAPMNVRRLFMADRFDRDKTLYDVMKSQERARVKPRFLRTRTFLEIMAPAFSAIFDLLGSCGVNEYDLAPVKASPNRLALAVYGKETRRFIGFDADLTKDFLAGLLFDPPDGLVAVISEQLEEAWNAASPVDALPHGDTRRAVALLGAHRWNRSRVIREALERGLRVVIAKPISDRGDVSSEVRALSHAVEVVPDDGVIESEQQRARVAAYGADWCAIPLDDYVTDLAATISSYGEQCYTALASETVKRKHLLRDLWNEIAARNPQLCRTEYCYVEFEPRGGPTSRLLSSEYESLPNTTGFVVKPDELSASIEIHRVESKNDAWTAAKAISDSIARTWGAAALDIGVGIRRRIVIEEEIRRSARLHLGAEFSAEFVSFTGKHHFVGITQKWTGDHFIETAHLFPAETFPEPLREPLGAAIRQILERLGVRYAVSHWEFIVTADQRLALVEGHLRPAGDRIMELIEYSTGKSPTGVLCEALATGAADFTFKTESAAAIFWMTPERPIGAVEHIAVEPVADPHIKDIVLDRAGIIAQPYWAGATNWTERYAHVLSSGPDFVTIKNSCDVVTSKITLSGTTNGVAQKTRLMLALQ